MIFFKHHDMALNEVTLDQVDDSPGPFCMSFGFDLEPLISSIDAIGLLNPPILRNDRGKMVIVAGYRRIKALKSLGAVRTPCRLISGGDMSPLECLLLNLYDNMATRTLNDMEKGMVLNRLAAWVPKEEIISRYMPLLGLRPHEKGLLFFQELERDSDVKTKSFVAEGGFSWRSVKMLTDLDAASRAAVTKAAVYLKLSINQQAQLIDILIDLSSIEDKGIPHILGELGLESPGSERGENRPQQAKAVLNHLRMRRNPTVVAAEKEFASKVNHLHLPDGVRITAPSFFEGEDYRMEILFKQGKDLKERLARLFQIEGLGRFKNPWDEIS